MSNVPPRLLVVGYPAQNLPDRELAIVCQIAKLGGLLPSLGGVDVFRVGFGKQNTNCAQVHFRWWLFLLLGIFGNIVCIIHLSNPSENCKCIHFFFGFG